MNMDMNMNMKNPTLPLELISEILLRLPVSSVMRFKLVCKSWLSLISEPRFGLSHYDLAASPSHRLILISNDYYAESIDIQTPLNMHSAVVRFPLPPTSPPFRDEYRHDHRDKHEIIGSCRGLVVLYYERSCDLIIWNPSIGVYELLPKFDYGLTRFYLYGFGYDTASDDYLLILIGLFNEYRSDDESEIDDSEDDQPEDAECKVNYQIICFKSDSFNTGDVFVSYEILADKFRGGVLFNEALHWLVFSKEKRVPVIFYFDLIQRSFSEIPLFDRFTMEEYDVNSFRVMGGCLSVCCSLRDYAMDEIWVMKEYKVESSWTKSVAFASTGFSPICIAGDGGIIGSNFSGRLEKLNDKGEVLDYFVYGEGQWLYSAELQSAVYRESLVSLSSVVPETREYDHGETSEDDSGETVFYRESLLSISGVIPQTGEYEHGETSEDEHGEISEDEHGETSEDDHWETSEDDHGETSEDDQQ
ncbi:F-box/kelch-repeat protein At3g23880 [Cajanus cajan]|uniref:F-box/kelch-repeat protein At3g23880 n=1 Tax=Cajanus cajan TaxID=3821 RepID=UPI00098DD052|nr:F-box/kelch-repeat protein At3g23880 [Cajanus cajan]